MKYPLWMVAALLLSILLMDVGTVYYVRAKMINSAEQALDAALIKALTVENYREGQLFIDESLGRHTARTIFKQNMNLNDSLENQFLKNTQFDVSFSRINGKPEAEVTVRTTIMAMSPKVIGLDGVPMTIRKTQFHIQKYIE